MKSTRRVLAATLAVWMVLVVAVPLAPAWGDPAGPSSVSGKPGCCAGVVLDGDASQCGPELSMSGNLCSTVCAGAYFTSSLECGTKARHVVAGASVERLTSRRTSPDPFPPKIRAVL